MNIQISYRIIEHKNKMDIQVIYPLIRKDIKLNIIYKEGSKPITISDNNPFENNSDHAPLQIVLKHTNRLREVLTKTVSAPTDGFDYRLAFDDLDNNKYYLLSDETNFTVEDKKRVKESFKYNKRRKNNKDSITITTVGFPNAGKTIFLASLFNYKKLNETRIEAEPFILNTIIKYFSKYGDDKKQNRAIELPINNVAGSGFSEYDIKSRYNIKVGNNIESGTSGTEHKTDYPIGFELAELGKLYFYDVPGELYQKNEKINDNAYNADCFIALIDGDKANGGAKAALAELRHALDNLKDAKGKPIDKPIAIVFTKHDKMLVEYVNEKSYTINSCFDENCHVVKENMLELMPKNHKYKGSLLERHIDNSSYELEHYLKSLNASGEGNGTFEDIISKYNNIKFFTCSALGSDQRLSQSGEKTDTREILFRPRRLRMELPIIWLMYQCGLIRR